MNQREAAKAGRGLRLWFLGALAAMTVGWGGTAACLLLMKAQPDHILLFAYALIPTELAALAGTVIYLYILATHNPRRRQ